MPILATFCARVSRAECVRIEQLPGPIRDAPLQFVMRLAQRLLGPLARGDVLDGPDVTPSATALVWKEISDFVDNSRLTVGTDEAKLAVIGRPGLGGREPFAFHPGAVIRMKVLEKSFVREDFRCRVVDAGSLLGDVAYSAFRDFPHPLAKSAKLGRLDQQSLPFLQRRLALAQRLFGPLSLADVGDTADVSGQFSVRIGFRQSLDVAVGGDAIRPVITVFGAVCGLVSGERVPLGGDAHAIFGMYCGEPAGAHGLLGGHAADLAPFLVDVGNQTLDVGMEYPDRRHGGQGPIAGFVFAQRGLRLLAAGDLPAGIAAIRDGVARYVVNRHGVPSPPPSGQSIPPAHRTNVRQRPVKAIVTVR